MSEHRSHNPYAGRSGFWNRVNGFFFPIVGPAQVGIGRPEAPYVPEPDPSCPLCGHRMAEHRIDRSASSMRTHVHCPPDPVPSEG